MTTNENKLNSFDDECSGFTQEEVSVVMQLIEQSEAIDNLMVDNIEDRCSKEELDYCSSYDPPAALALKGMLFTIKAHSVLNQVLETSPLPPVTHQLMFKSKQNENHYYTEQIQPPEGYPNWDTVCIDEQTAILKVNFLKLSPEFIITITPVLALKAPCADKLNSFTGGQVKDISTALMNGGSEGVAMLQASGLVMKITSNSGISTTYYSEIKDCGNFSFPPKVVPSIGMSAYDGICEPFSGDKPLTA